MRLIVRRVKPTPGSQLALFARYSYHAFITDRDGETLELEADHRRHAEVENASITQADSNPPLARSTSARRKVRLSRARVRPQRRAATRLPRHTCMC